MRLRGPAVVGQRPEERVGVDLISGAGEAAGVGRVDVVSVRADDAKTVLDTITRNYRRFERGEAGPNSNAVTGDGRIPGQCRIPKFQKPGADPHTASFAAGCVGAER